MPVLKTHAIPLYWADVTNTSRVVTWLTAHYGKLSTLIKGDLRKKSLFRGQYAQFSTSELLFYDRTERGLHIAKECCLLHARPVFRSDWKACASAGYITALFAKTSPRAAHEPQRFPFLEEMLTFCEIWGSAPAFVHWFDLHFAAFHGQSIRLTLPPADEAGWKPGKARRFSAAHGGLVSSAAAKADHIAAAAISDEAVSLMRRWQADSTPESAIQEEIRPPILQQIERVLDRFITFHFDLPPRIRRTAMGILHHSDAGRGPIVPA